MNQPAFRREKNNSSNNVIDMYSCPCGKYMVTMKISVKKYKKSDLQDWNQFITDSNNGTIFHYRDFLNYHIDRTFHDHSLIFSSKGRIIAVFPAAEVIDGGNRILYSHPGASFGGFVFQKLSYKNADDIINILVEYCQQNDFNETFFVPTPRIYYRDYCETFD